MSSLIKVRRGDVFYMKDRGDSDNRHPVIILSKEFAHNSKVGGHGYLLQYMSISSCSTYGVPKFAVPIEIYGDRSYILPHNINSCFENDISFKCFLGHLDDNKLINLLVYVHALGCVDEPTFEENVEKMYNEYVEEFNKEHPDLKDYVPVSKRDDYVEPQQQPPAYSAVITPVAEETQGVKKQPKLQINREDNTDTLVYSTEDKELGSIDTSYQQAYRGQPSLNIPDPPVAIKRTVYDHSKDTKEEKSKVEEPEEEIVDEPEEEEEHNSELSFEAEYSLLDEERQYRYDLACQRIELIKNGARISKIKPPSDITKMKLENRLFFVMYGKRNAYKCRNIFCYKQNTPFQKDLKTLRDQLIGEGWTETLLDRYKIVY